MSGPWHSALRDLAWAVSAHGFGFDVFTRASALLSEQTTGKCTHKGFTCFTLDTLCTECTAVLQMCTRCEGIFCRCAENTSIDIPEHRRIENMDIEELRELVVDINRINDLEARVTSLEASAHVVRSDIIVTRTDVSKTRANVDAVQATLDQLVMMRKTHGSNPS